jgi:hypothetical protein
LTAGKCHAENKQNQPFAFEDAYSFPFFNTLDIYPCKFTGLLLPVIPNTPVLPCVPCAWLCGWLLPWPSQACAEDGAASSKRSRKPGMLPAVLQFPYLARQSAPSCPPISRQTYTIKHSTSATRLNLSPRETPQAGRW